MRKSEPASTEISESTHVRSAAANEGSAFAWQEAIVNAVAHRDYRYEGLSIEVWMFDDHMEIRHDQKRQHKTYGMKDAFGSRR